MLHCLREAKRGLEGLGWLTPDMELILSKVEQKEAEQDDYGMGELTAKFARDIVRKAREVMGVER